MSTLQVIDTTDGGKGHATNETRTSAVVLLAEDNDDTRRVYGLILRHYGYQVAEASNGEDAVALTRATLPSLVLMDIGLPKLDGWEASRMLKADSATAHIPLIAFSAHIDSMADLAGRSGFDGYIHKPVSPGDLIRRLAEYLQQPRPK
jgi:CheY-like chemotaxis protein